MKPSSSTTFVDAFCHGDVIGEKISLVFAHNAFLNDDGWKSTCLCALGTDFCPNPPLLGKTGSETDSGMDSFRAASALTNFRR